MLLAVTEATREADNLTKYCNFKQNMQVYATYTVYVSTVKGRRERGWLTKMVVDTQVDGSETNPWSCKASGQELRMSVCVCACLSKS